MIEQNKLLLEKINQNILNLNNFKNFNEKSIFDEKVYYKNLTDFYFFVNKQNNSLPKSNIEHFSNNSVSNYQVKEINEIYNPIIDKFNKQLIQKNKEYRDEKIKFNHINNILNKNIENLDYIYNKGKLIEPFKKKYEKGKKGAKKTGGAIKEGGEKTGEAVSDTAKKAEEEAKRKAEAAKRAAEEAARRAAEEARRAAEEAKRIAELIKKKIKEAIDRVKKETEKIKKQIVDKLKELNKVLDMIKKIRDEIVQVQKKIINSVRESYIKAATITKSLPIIYKNTLAQQTKKVDATYKIAAKIKNGAILKAKKDLDKAYKEARRIKSGIEGPNIEKDEPLDTSDFELSADDANKDLDAIKNATNVEMPKPKPEVSPFILVFIIIGVVFILHEFILPPLK